MANYTGAVRFPDGTLLWCSYYGTCDQVRRLLFESADLVDHDQNYLPAAREVKDDVEVDVMPYFCHGNQDVLFRTRASRLLGLITGPVTALEADQELESEQGWFSPYAFG